MDIFKRPYLESEKEFHFSYDLDTLKKVNIFPYLIMDGGAYYVIKDVLGENWNGDMIAEKVMDGSFFEKWSRNGIFDWDFYQKGYANSKVEAPMEIHVWINRLYFLIPLASKFLKTGDESYTEKWYEYFCSWINAYPYERKNDSDEAVQEIWKEMQVAWRLIGIIYCAAMLSESKFLTKEKWEIIYDFMRLHAKHLLGEGSGHIKDENAHNHVLQIGVALLYVGCLYPEFDDSEKYKQAGKRIVEIQLKRALFADGGSLEDSPSYSLFIARLYVECELLLKKNGEEGLEGLIESLQKQYEWVHQMSPESDNTLLINDSYNTSVKREIALINELIPISVSPKKSVIFADSKCAALRNDNFELFIDAMEHTQWHQHAGRPNFVVYYKGKPIVADSGCCGYDNHGMHQYLWGEWAHNTLCLSKQAHPDKSLKPVDNIEIINSDEKNGLIEFSVKGERENVAFSRIRKFELLNEGIKIIDTVEVDEEMNMELLTHIAALDVDFNREKRVCTVNSTFGEDIEISLNGDVDDCYIEYHPIVDEKTNFTYSPVLTADKKSKKAQFITEIRINQ